ANVGFEEVVKNPASPAFVRALALFGLAETARARQDLAGAEQIWRRIADDTSLPAAYRSQAQAHLREVQAPSRPGPGRDGASHRESLPQLPEPAAVFHVAPSGSDSAEGTAAHPFATLARSRDAVRELKKAHDRSLPPGGVRILISGGVFRVTEPLELTTADSGTAEAPVVYEAMAKQTPVFTGGRPVQGWKPVTAAEVLEKLDPSVRGQILEADLKTNGIVEWGDATRFKHRPELFVDGVPQTLARWPNAGFVKTGEVLAKEPAEGAAAAASGKEGIFRFLEDRPLRWLDEPDVRLYGYWYWDWFEEYQRVASIDPTNRTFTLARPYSNYGYRKDQRYYAVNVFRELDQPGEWYLDRRAGRIFWLPPKGIDPGETTCVLSVLTEPFVVMKNVNHVLLVGLTLQESRGDGIQIQGGTNCLVARCTLRRLGGDAVTIEGGHHHGVFGSFMNTLGCGAMRVQGGDRQTLEPGRHFVENCTVADISRLKRTYAPAVLLDGCGNRVAHNLFERIPSSAIRIEGNDHLIELNRVRDVVQESDDQGGIDIWGNPLYRGIVIRWNRWSDIQGGTTCGAAGIRLDDMISGVTIQGNLFERCGAVQFGGVQIHGGKENLVDGNVFINCFAGTSHSRWGQARWLKGIESFLRQAGEEPYATRYPELARLSADADVNSLCRNLFLHCGSILLRDGGTQQTTLNLTQKQPLSPETLSDADAVRRNPLLRRVLFEPIPVEQMGPYDHPWRAPLVEWGP
ncbi:MAG: right-handed parallel beta-helix repeat-containing protein, partial [Verrucomicrobia bacterium]|nr:right-handed parallel beta-helix repeat-containing protein [Verrucomicrobiota bacterium]